MATRDTRMRDTRIRDIGDQHQNEVFNARRRAQQERADSEFADMLKARPFRAFVWGLLERTGVVGGRGDLLFEVDTVNASNFYRQSGLREIGTPLLNAVLKADPAALPVMAAEAAQRAKELNDG